ncbi:MAG: hypothetical protein ACRES7_03255 [Gammaproteobacteria bacterium]
MLVLAGCASSTGGSVQCSGGSGGGNCTVKITETWQFAPQSPNNIDVSQLETDFTTQNVAMADGTYSATIEIYDGNNLVDSYSFDYYVSGGQATPADPSAVQSWLDAHDGDGDSATVNAPGLTYTVTNPNASSGQVTATSYDDGQEITSATSTFAIGNGGGGCKYNCKQKGPTSPPRSDP